MPKDLFSSLPSLPPLQGSPAGDSRVCVRVRDRLCSGPGPGPGSAKAHRHRPLPRRGVPGLRRRRSPPPPRRRRPSSRTDTRQHGSPSRARRPSESAPVDGSLSRARRPSESAQVDGSLSRARRPSESAQVDGSLSRARRPSESAQARRPAADLPSESLRDQPARPVGSHASPLPSRARGRPDAAAAAHRQRRSHRVGRARRGRRGGPPFPDPSREDSDDTSWGRQKTPALRLPRGLAGSTESATDCRRMRFQTVSNFRVVRGPPVRIRLRSLCRGPLATRVRAQAVPFDLQFILRPARRGTARPNKPQ